MVKNFLIVLKKSTADVIRTASKRAIQKTAEVVFVHCDIINNDYQQDSQILYTFVLYKPFGSFLEISPTNHICLKTFNSKYSEIKVWFTDQNSKQLEIEDRINLTMVIK